MHAIWKRSLFVLDLNHKFELGEALFRFFRLLLVSHHLDFATGLVLHWLKIHIVHRAGSIKSGALGANINQRAPLRAEFRLLEAL